MRKLILVAHISLDGFVAGKNGELEILEQSPENLDFINTLTDSADALLAGRHSFQLLDAYWPHAHNDPNASPSEIKYSRWYNQAQKIVLSKKGIGKNSSGVTVLSENIGSELAHIKRQPGKDILMFGSPNAFQSLRGLQLIDEYWLIVYPILLGEGIPLFGPETHHQKMKLIHSRPFTKGEIAIHYRVETE